MKKNPYIPAVLYLIAAMMPMAIGFGAVSAVLAAALLVLYYVMLGSAFWGIAGAAVFLLALAVEKFNIMNAAVFTALTLPVSFFIGRGFSKKRSFTATLVPGAISGIVAAAGVIAYMMQEYKTTAFNVLFGSSVEAMKEAFAQTGMQMQDTFDSFLSQFELAMPAMIVIAICLGTYIVFGVSRTWLARNGVKFDNMPLFSELRLGSAFTTIFLLTVALSLFSGVNAITLNIITVVSVMFSICGISVCDYFLKSRNIKTVFRIIIYIAVFFLIGLTGYVGTVFGILLFLVGVFDSYRPLRKRDSEII